MLPNMNTIPTSSLPDAIKMAESSMHVADVVSDAVVREIEDAFEKGEKASLTDVLNELESIVPGDMLPTAAKMAYEIFREEMKAHLKEVHGVMLSEAMRTGKGQDYGEAFARYANEVFVIIRTASADPAFDYPTAVNMLAYQLHGLTILATSVLKLIEVAVKLRSTIAQYRAAMARIDAQADAEISSLKIRELIRELKEAFLELDEAIEQLKREHHEDSALAVVLKAAAAKHLDQEIAEWRKLVSGFTARMDRLRDETRDEIKERGEEHGYLKV